MPSPRASTSTERRPNQRERNRDHEADDHHAGLRRRGDAGARRAGGGTMAELIVDFITSLDGYASAEGWPGWWGLRGPDYLAWLDERPERDYTLLMGAN